jgi:hypothetical protein
MCLIIFYYKYINKIFYYFPGQQKHAYAVHNCLANFDIYTLSRYDYPKRGDGGKEK